MQQSSKSSLVILPYVIQRQYKVIRHFHKSHKWLNDIAYFQSNIIAILTYSYHNHKTNVSRKCQMMLGNTGENSKKTESKKQINNETLSEIY